MNYKSNRCMHEKRFTERVRLNMRVVASGAG
jgi:hypothetical protein